MQENSANESQLSREQKAMEMLWEEHLASEFKFKNAETAINTMVDRPSVNHVPVMTGGVGRRQLTHFYDRYFIPQMPPDTQIIPVSRTIGHDRVVDEFVIKFTHSLQMDWLLPGVPPTNKQVEVATVTVIQFQDGKDGFGAHLLGSGLAPGPVGSLGSGKTSRRRSSNRAKGA
jgi:carboxymethylenebutenolidase